MAEVTTPAEAIKFLRENVRSMTADDRETIAYLAEAHASAYLDLKVEYGATDREFIDTVDEALAAVRGGDFQRATYLLERNASWAGKCSASAAWTNAGRPECGRLL